MYSEPGGRRGRGRPPAMLAWLCFAWLASLPSFASGQTLRVEFFDVGQGDAALITSPTGKTVLVDAGPPGAAAALGRRLSALPQKIDLVLLSHRHADHMAALPRIISERPGVRTFIDADLPWTSPGFAKVLRSVVAHQVEVRNAVFGRRIDLGGGATLTLYGPPAPPITGTRSDENANSIVARLEWKKLSILLCGDAEAETERRLLSSGATLSARVVKVAHHGSAYSSTAAFVRAVSPEIAVVSAGVHNEYGHPDRQVIERWEHAGARVYRTDMDGDITLVSDGTNVTLHTARDRAETAVAAAQPGVHAGQGQRRDRATDSTSNARPGGYVASRRSPAFHLEGCPAALTIAPRNQLRFASRDEALASGRRPAQDCHP